MSSRRSPAGKANRRRTAATDAEQAVVGSPSREVAELLKGDMFYGAGNEPKDQRKGRKSSTPMQASPPLDANSHDKDSDFSGTAQPDNKRATRATTRKSRHLLPLEVDTKREDSTPEASAPPSPTETLHPLADPPQPCEEAATDGDGAASLDSIVHATPLSAAPSIVIQPGGLRGLSTATQLSRGPLTWGERIFFCMVVCPLSITLFDTAIRQGAVTFSDLRSLSKESAKRLDVLDKVLDDQIVPLLRLAICGFRWVVEHGTEIAALGLLTLAFYKLFQPRRALRANAAVA